MAVLPIVITGEPVLHRPAQPVTAFDRTLAELVESMFETNALAPGVGLAAPQVGVDQRVFIWDYADQDDAPARGVAVNPELWIAPPEPGLPDDTEAEGCLSFPGERFPLRRSPRALLRAHDVTGEPFEILAHGWFARILQHEFDHLNGILYVDRLLHPESKAAQRAKRRNGWGEPGVSWLPGTDDIDA